MRAELGSVGSVGTATASTVASTRRRAASVATTVRMMMLCFEPTDLSCASLLSSTAELRNPRAEYRYRVTGTSQVRSCPLLVGAALVLGVAEAALDVCAGACGRLPRHHPPVDSSEPPVPSPQVGCGSRASGSATGVSKLKNMAESVRTEPVHLRQPLRTPLHARAATCPALYRCFPHACGLSACSCPLSVSCMIPRNEDAILVSSAELSR